MIGAAKIAVVGSANIDLVAYTPRVPGSGETLVGERFQMGFGGKGANQAVMARLLGAEVMMVACLGDDAYGDMTIENFSSYGVDTGHIHRTAGSSGVAHIWVEPDGTNRIVIIPGANAALTRTEAASAVGAVSDLSVVVGQLEIPQDVTKAAFAAGRDAGGMTILNPAPAIPLDRDLLDVTSWLIPNEVEFEALTGRPASDDDALISFTRKTGVRLLVTLGENGVALVSPSEVVHRVPAVQRDAIDTTGAGDAFVGAFAFGLASGLDELDAIALGIACAGDSVTAAGAQTSFPNRARSADLLEQVLP